ncbi:MAG: ABC transporter ATP-binding protein [Bacteroidota bacterium]
MIELHNVSKNFGTFTAVDDLSLIIPGGELFGFLGPNGAGKTTTIKMIAGLFAPTKGVIRVNGHDIVANPLEAKSTIAYIPDQPFLYDKLTGREFLYFVGGLYSLPKEHLHRRVGEVIEHFEIGQWVDKKAEDYSQGMRQRISIAAGLIHEPRTLIIDEPMIGLDPRSSKIVRETLRQQADRGVSILMSTHSLPTAEELCDRIGIIHRGKLVYCDTRDGVRAFEASLDGKLESVFLELTR